MVARVLVRLVLWDLDGSSTTIDELRDYLREESVDNFSRVEGLRLKLWVSDRERNRWGAVYLWDSEDASKQPLPAKARQIIGKDPDFVEVFELEASTVGVSPVEALSRLGLAFE